MAHFTVDPSCFDLYENFKFRIKWGGRYVAGISKVSSLEPSIGVAETRREPSIGRKLPGKTEYKAVTLERGLTGDLEFQRWARKVRNWDSGPRGEAPLTSSRRDMIIEVCNEAGHLVTAYEVSRCWPSEYQALPVLNADASAVAIQTLTLQHEGLAQDSEVTEPSGFTGPQSIRPLATWQDLVLPAAQTAVLRSIVSRTRQELQLYESWDSATRCARTLGISALFDGASGTGKTMAAEVLANELQLDFYDVDLSQVASKYVGETEEYLRRVFDEAEVGGAILLFDEAEALFSKRSEVKDSHDRYADMEISYLLQRMEGYRGLTILTTRRKDSLDAAFLRRLSFIVHFPFPGEAEREEIWRRIFPAETHTEGLDFTRLAQLDMAGGNIRNIALHAAFLAARSGGPVTMSHLLEGAHAESAKLQRPLSPAEISGWR